MKKQFSPGDIRNLLGISRSAIRYYMDKGLISARKMRKTAIPTTIGAILKKCLMLHILEIV